MILSLDFKSAFLDSEAVLARTTKAQRRALARAGGLTRTIAKKSMRPYYRKSKKNGGALTATRASRPGEPPRRREGSLHRLLFFAYDPARESVFVGPVGFPNSELPRVFEFGGSVTETNRFTKQKITKRIEPRPYMSPALKTAEPELPAIFGQSIRREF